MYKNAPLISLFVLLLLSACSTYTTNTELNFESTQIRSRPAITIGDIEQTPNQLTYLGWVDAVVRSPGPFHSPPNREQVDLVLSHLGQQLDADAIIHVNYRERSAPFGLARSYEARGQAVRILSEREQEHQPLSLSGFSHRVGDDRTAAEETGGEKTAGRPASTPPAPRQRLGFSAFDPDNYRALIAHGDADGHEQLNRIEAMLEDARLIQKQAYENSHDSIYNAASRLIQMLEIQRRQYQQP